MVYGRYIYTDWWYTYSCEKYDCQWEGLSHILWKIKMFQTTNPLVYGRYIYTDWWYTYPSEKI